MSKNQNYSTFLNLQVVPTTTHGRGIKKVFCLAESFFTEWSKQIYIMDLIDIMGI